MEQQMPPPSQDQQDEPSLQDQVLSLLDELVAQKPELADAVEELKGALNGEVERADQGNVPVEAGAQKVKPVV